MSFETGAAALGAETESPVRMPRPRFRYFLGPIVSTVVFLLFAALAAFGYLTFRASMSPEFYRSMVYASAIMFGISVLAWIWWLSLGVTMSPHERGIVMTRRNKQFVFLYDEIDALTVADRARYDDARNVAAYDRVITIEANGQKAVARYLALPQDALDGLLQRFVARLASEPRPRSGAKWELDAMTLRWRGETIPLGAIVKAGVFDKEVRVWRANEAMHFMAVPYASRNARVLLQRLRTSASATPSTITERKTAAATVLPSTAQDGIGRLLFTRRTSFLSVLFKSAAIAAVLWVAELWIDKQLPQFQRLGHGAIIGLAVLAVFHALYRITMRFRFHERGLTRSTILGNRTMLYAAVEKMLWKETVTMIGHGIAVGATLKFQLAGGDGTKLRMNVHRFRTGDPDVEPVRNTIAHGVAHRLRTKVEREGRVVWTRNATFLREGLEVKTGLLGGKTELVPYDSTLNVAFSGAYLNVFRQSWRQPLVILDTREENFFPGLELFSMLMENVHQPGVEHTA